MTERHPIPSREPGIAERSPAKEADPRKDRKAHDRDNEADDGLSFFLE
jgi:hypothetical protein